MNLIVLLSSDAVPTVLAAEWDASADLFDGEQAKGPVPRLFALYPTEARPLQQPRENPQGPTEDLRKVGRDGKHSSKLSFRLCYQPQVVIHIV
jgi:hypothetical protein